MEPSREAHDEWLRQTLDELDRVEQKIEAVRPHNQIRRRLLLLFLLAQVVGAGVAISVRPSLLASSVFGLVAFVSLTTWVAIIAPHHRLKALEWRRDELLGRMGPPPPSDVRHHGTDDQ